jgi:hypothetical protein
MMENKLSSDNLGQLELDSTANAERDLLETLIRAQEVRSAAVSNHEFTEAMMQVEENPTATVAYPWNPAALEAEAFFAQSEPSSILDGLDDELSSRADRFFAKIDQLWATAAPLSLQEVLVQRFAARIPQASLMAIAQRAQTLVSSSLASADQLADQLANQLVQCVSELTPNLATEDLFVLARPFAYQMRNGGLQDAIDSTVAQIPQLNWEQLSDLQQAKLSLAVARCAFAELQPQNPA